MKNVYESIISYLKKYPPAYEVFDKLLKAGDLYLIGGILREYRDKGDIVHLRDADFIIRVREQDAWQKLLQTYVVENNRFGGYKLSCGGLMLDIWELEKTWAYKQNVFSCKEDEYLKCLPKTVFLNLDSIIYDLKNDIWYDEIYVDAMKKKMLDVVLRQNPFPELNIIRAMILRRRYRMEYAQNLKNVISAELSARDNIVANLMDIQIKRYGSSILSKDEIAYELELCKW